MRIRRIALNFYDKHRRLVMPRCECEACTIWARAVMEVRTERMS